VLTAGSLGLTLVVLCNAWVQRQQFYPSVVYITKSNPSMAVIYLQSLVLVILTGKLMRKIFFGQLRAAEFEHLMERSWYAVTETCLAFTVFKDDFSPKFVALFTLLLFLKSFHWLAEDRVDLMERSPVISLLFHLRVLSLAMVLASLDMFFMQHAYTSTLTKGASVQLVFGFEYAILLTMVVNTVVKYVLHSIDLHSETPWENKAVFMLYTELAVGLVKVLLYLLFFVIMVRIYTLPLFAVRPMYLTMRAFKKAFNDVVLSRRAIHNMNTLYPDATPEELSNTDNVCIICREEMTDPSATKKLPCGHIFHRTCLRSWFQRQQTCPTCRLDVLRAPASASQPQQQAAQPPQNNQQQQFQAQMAILRQQLEAMQAGRQQQQQQAAAQPQAAAAPVPAAAAAAAPPLPPNIFNFAAGAQAQAAAPTAAATQAPTSHTTEGAQAAQGAASSIPRLVPPFPFMPYIPPPLPPPNFSGMSTAELMQMEGQERSNVEARIKCLRNIQVLLDAAVMEMQQYSNVVARCNTTASQAAPTEGTSVPGSQSPSTAATSATVTPLTSTFNSASLNSTISTSSDQSCVQIAPTSSSVTSSDSMSSSTSSSTTTITTTINVGNISCLRPSSETGARPKGSPPTGPSQPDPDTVKSQQVEEKLDTNKDNINDVEIKENSDKQDSSNQNGLSEQEEIRKRRLAVFEEQKKRLMSK